MPIGTGAERRYSPADFFRVDKTRVADGPDWTHISTPIVERQNITMRMSMRRFTRLTNGFSKKIENHIHVMVLYFAVYNLVRDGGRREERVVALQRALAENPAGRFSQRSLFAIACGQVDAT